MRQAMVGPLHRRSAAVVCASELGSHFSPPTLTISPPSASSSSASWTPFERYPHHGQRGRPEDQGGSVALASLARSSSPRRRLRCRVLADASSGRLWALGSRAQPTRTSGTTRYVTCGLGSSVLAAELTLLSSRTADRDQLGPDRLRLQVLSPLTSCVISSCLSGSPLDVCLHLLGLDMSLAEAHWAFLGPGGECRDPPGTARRRPGADWFCCSLGAQSAPQPRRATRSRSLRLAAAA
jgi:hypothetical protein